jgi:hypothetical protein
MPLRKHRSLTAMIALACVDFPPLRPAYDFVPDLITADVPGYAKSTYFRSASSFTFVVLVILGEDTAELTRSSLAGTSTRADLASG